MPQLTFQPVVPALEPLASPEPLLPLLPLLPLQPPQPPEGVRPWPVS